MQGKPFVNCPSLLSIQAPGMEIDSFQDKSDKVSAALGYCRDSDRYKDQIRAGYEAYIKANMEAVLSAVITRNMPDAAAYIAGNFEIGTDVYTKMLERAQREKKMELVTVLLEHRKTAGAGIDVMQMFSIDE